MKGYELDFEMMYLLFLVYMDVLYIVSSYVDIDFNCKCVSLTLGLNCEVKSGTSFI
jgi:hypothetical protein